MKNKYFFEDIDVFQKVAYLKGTEVSDPKCYSLSLRFISEFKKTAKYFREVFVGNIVKKNSLSLIGESKLSVSTEFYKNLRSKYIYKACFLLYGKIKENCCIGEQQLKIYNGKAKIADLKATGNLSDQIKVDFNYDYNTFFSTGVDPPDYFHLILSKSCKLIIGNLYIYNET